MLVKSKHIPSYKLENMLGNHERGVAVRRHLISKSLDNEAALKSLPYSNYDYKYVSWCEISMIIKSYIFPEHIVMHYAFMKMKHH